MTKLVTLFDDPALQFGWLWTIGEAASIGSFADGYVKVTRGVVSKTGRFAQLNRRFDDLFRKSAASVFN